METAKSNYDLRQTLTLQKFSKKLRAAFCTAPQTFYEIKPLGAIKNTLILIPLRAK